MNALTLTTLQPLGRSSCYWLSIGIQTQWGLASTKIGRTPAPFPIAFPNAVFSVVAVSNYTSFAISKLTLTGFNTVIGSDTGDGLVWWFAIGKQQWGYTGEQSNKIVFPLKYTRAVFVIIPIVGDGIPQPATNVTLSGATSVGYTGTGTKTYWISIGV